MTPYGDPLLPALMTAMLFTALQCVVALAIAFFLGCLAAFLWQASNSILSHAISTLVGIMESLGPVLPTIAILSSLQASSEWTTALITGCMTWNIFAAFIKSETDTLARSMFVQASIGLGASTWGVFSLHIVPSITPRLVPLLLGVFASYVGIFGALGFLGVTGNVNHSLGFMLYDAKSFVRQNPSYFLGTLIALITLIISPYLMGKVAKHGLDIPSPRKRQIN